MATPKKIGDVWRIQLFVRTKNGDVRESGSFRTKAEASAWHARRSIELKDATSPGKSINYTCAQAFERYEKEVSKHKRGYRWEALRLNAFARSSLGSLNIADVTVEHVALWRDERLATGVSGSTVNREISLLSHMFTIARKEWRWVNVSPIPDLRRPRESPPRDRRITQNEIDMISVSLGFDEDVATTKSQAVAIAFLFAIETAMRCGEICGLMPEDIVGRVAQLHMTKNGTKRSVPLTTRAIQLLGFLPKTESTLFGIKTATVDALFRKCKARCGITNLTFHDTRHEAVTRLAAKLNVLDLARMIGHRDLKMLQVYYNASAEEIAGRLD